MHLLVGSSEHPAWGSTQGWSRGWCWYLGAGRQLRLCWEVLQTKHRVGADLLGVSPTGLPAPAQKPILLSFTSPAVCWLGGFPWVTCILRRIGQCVGSSGCLSGFVGCSPSSSAPVFSALTESPVISSPISPLVAAEVVVHNTAAWLVLELGSLQGITCLLLEPARSGSAPSGCALARRCCCVPEITESTGLQSMALRQATS